MTDVASTAATGKRGPSGKSAGPPPSAPPAPPAPPGGRGGRREGAGRKSAKTEGATDKAHILRATALAHKEGYLAKLAELDYKIKSGEYVARAEVRQATSTAFATIAQTLRSIPDNLERRLGISPAVAQEIELLIDGAMNDLADQLEKMSRE